MGHLARKRRTRRGGARQPSMLRSRGFSENCYWCCKARVELRFWGLCEQDQTGEGEALVGRRTHTTAAKAAVDSTARGGRRGGGGAYTAERAEPFENLAFYSSLFLHFSLTNSTS